MRFPPALLLSTPLFVGLFLMTGSVWSSPILTADADCGEAQVSNQSTRSQPLSGQASQSQPCASHNQAFSLMLPLITGNGKQEDAPPQGPADNPTTAPTSNPSTNPPSGPLATPMPEATTKPTTTLPPTKTPIPGQLLFDPPVISTLTHAGNGLNVSWTGCDGASSFRVLYGPSGARPRVATTTDQMVSIPNVDGTSTHNIVIECYDGLGNSVFSSPRVLEVGR